VSVNDDSKEECLRHKRSHHCMDSCRRSVRTFSGSASWMTGHRPKMAFVGNARCLLSRQSMVFPLSFIMFICAENKRRRTVLTGRQCDAGTHSLWKGRLVMPMTCSLPCPRLPATSGSWQSGLSQQTVLHVQALLSGKSSESLLYCVSCRRGCGTSSTVGVAVA
jgi:hypothetical protein